MDAIDIRNIAEAVIREHEQKYHTGEPEPPVVVSPTPAIDQPPKPMFRRKQWVVERGPVLYKTVPWQIGGPPEIQIADGKYSYLKESGVWWDESDLRLAKPSDFREKLGEVEAWAETNKDSSVSIFMDGRLTGRVHKPEIVPVKYFDAEIEMLRWANIPIIPLEVLNGDNEKPEDDEHARDW